MVCHVCREDLPKEQFAEKSYLLARIQGMLVPCLVCTKLPKKQRSAKRNLALSMIRGGRVFTGNGGKLKNPDKAWNRMTPDQKRTYLVLNRTKYEKMLDEGLLKARINFSIQVPTCGYFLDFRIFPHKLAVEIDGNVHDTKANKKHDAKRTEELSSRGWTIVRFRNEDVQQRLDYVIDSIKEVVKVLDKPRFRPNQVVFVPKETLLTEGVS